MTHRHREEESGQLHHRTSCSIGRFSAVTFDLKPETAPIQSET